jgi:hypothetical protein
MFEILVQRRMGKDKSPMGHNSKQKFQILLILKVFLKFLFNIKEHGADIKETF